MTKRCSSFRSRRVHPTSPRAPARIAPFPGCTPFGPDVNQGGESLVGDRHHSDSGAPVSIRSMIMALTSLLVTVWSFGVLIAIIDIASCQSQHILKRALCSFSKSLPSARSFSRPTFRMRCGRARATGLNCKRAPRIPAATKTRWLLVYGYHAEQDSESPSAVQYPDIPRDAL